MLIDLLNEKNMSVYQCSKISGIPYTTLLEVVNGKTDINKCSAETVYRLANVFNVSMEQLLEKDNIDKFEAFKSSIKHLIKDLGAESFLSKITINNEIRTLWRRCKKAYALYLLATIDYLCRINDFPLLSDYDDLRCYALQFVLLPEDIKLKILLTGDKSIEQKALGNSIPEFAQYNIVECDIFDAI